MNGAIIVPVTEPPRGVRVTRYGSAARVGYRENARQLPAELEIRGRAVGARGILVVVFAVIWNAIIGTAIFGGGAPPAFMIVHVLAGVLLCYFSIKQLRNGFVLRLDGNGLAATQQANSEARREHLALAEVTGFFCEPATIELGAVGEGASERPILRDVHHVCARLSDGRVKRLLIEIENREVAFFVAQLLERELREAPR